MSETTLSDLHNGVKGLTSYVKGEFSEVNQRLGRIESDIKQIKDILISREVPDHIHDRGGRVSQVK